MVLQNFEFENDYELNCLKHGCLLYELELHLKNKNKKQTKKKNQQEIDIVQDLQID